MHVPEARATTHGTTPYDYRKDSDRVIGRVQEYPLHPAFAVSWFAYSVGPSSIFQVQPPVSDCDPVLASTPHRSGMQVALADGSVRTLSPSISPATWWAACTPRSLDLLGADW